MTFDSSIKASLITRRQAVNTAGKAIAGLVGLAVLPAADAKALPQPMPPSDPAGDPSPAEKLRVATCQFPVSADCKENARYVRGFLRDAVLQGAHLLHTPEASLSGYAGCDFKSFDKYDWDTLRRETKAIQGLAKESKMWLALGSSHFLDAATRPTDCIYLIDPTGKIVDRYDKSFCTTRDQEHYSAGNRLVTRDIRGVKIGLAVCYDICWPQIYIAYRERGVTVMIHSMHNARDKSRNCLDTLNVREVPTRCADNRMWAVCNNSSQPYSHWGAFIARPDATIPKQLGINQPGMLIHDFPDTLSPDGWYHNLNPMRMRDDEIMTLGTPSNHPRQLDPQSEA